MVPLLGLATGRTMEPVYAALRSRILALAPAEREPLLARWRSFNLDEYVGLAADHPASFAAFMRQQVGDPLSLAAQCLQLPDGVAADPDQEARRYAAALEAAGGLDLQLLGLGGNGHVGFNEPPCGPEAPCRCLELSAATRRQNAAAFGGDPEAVPPRAITLGTAEILAARELLLVVTGEAKALANTLAGHADVDAIWRHDGDVAGCAEAEKLSAANLKRCWTGGAKGRDWADPAQGRSQEFLRQASQVKNIWVPYGV